MAAFPLFVEVRPNTVRFEPGQSADIEVLIRNVSDNVGAYDVSVVGLAAGQLLVEAPPTTRLLPKESATVRLRVGIPTSGGPAGGRHVLAVLVRSPTQPDLTRAEELALDVIAVSGAGVTVQPEVAYGEPHAAAYVVTVRNDGNVSPTLSFAGTDQEGRSRFEFRPPSVSPSPGATATVNVTVRAKAPWTGYEKRRRVTIRALAGDQVWGEAAAEFVQRPRLSSGLLRALGALLALAVIAGSIVGGAWLARSQDGDGSSSDEPTQEPSDDVTASPGEPQIAQINVAPAAPQAGSDVTFSASVPFDVTSWLWTVSDEAGTEVVTSTDPSQFTHQFEAGGAYGVELRVSGPPGEAVRAQAFVVADPAARFQLARTDVPATAGEVVEGGADCPEGRVAVGGGVTPVEEAEDTEATPSTLVDSGVGLVESRWRATLVHEGDGNGTVAVLAVCAEPSAGQVVIRERVLLAPGAFLRESAGCPIGTVVLGGGAAAPDVPREARTLVVRESAPGTVGTEEHVWLSALTNQGDASVGVDLLAICAPAPEGYEVVPVAVGAEPGAFVDQTVPCPPGKVAVAGGAQVAGEGTADFGTVVGRNAPSLTATQPLAAWRLTLLNGDDQAHNLTVSAICVSDSAVSVPSG